jgi:hypothetical protein
MKEYRAPYDTWIRGRQLLAGKTMMLLPEKAAGYVKSGLLVDVEAEAAEAAKKAKAETKGAAGKVAKEGADAGKDA